MKTKLFLIMLITTIISCGPREYVPVPVNLDGAGFISVAETSLTSKSGSKEISVDPCYYFSALDANGLDTLYEVNTVTQIQSIVRLDGQEHATFTHPFAFEYNSNTYLMFFTPNPNPSPVQLKTYARGTNFEGYTDFTSENLFDITSLQTFGSGEDYYAVSMPAFYDDTLYFTAHLKTGINGRVKMYSSTLDASSKFGAITEITISDFHDPEPPLFWVGSFRFNQDKSAVYFTKLSDHGQPPSIWKGTLVSNTITSPVKIATVGPIDSFNFLLDVGYNGTYDILYLGVMTGELPFGYGTEGYVSEAISKNLELMSNWSTQGSLEIEILD